jgi:hypothetical protein
MFCRWAQLLNVREGVLTDVFTLMNAKGKTLSEQERHVLLYEETFLSGQMCFDLKWRDHAELC